MPEPPTTPDLALTTAIQGLAAWTGDLLSIHRSIECATFPAAITLVNQVAEEAEAMDHHPDIDIRWRTVTFRLSTHVKGRVTDLDVTLARAIDRLIDQL